jgi:hypothetical protein
MILTEYEENIIEDIIREETNRDYIYDEQTLGGELGLYFFSYINIFSEIELRLNILIKPEYAYFLEEEPWTTVGSFKRFIGNQDI